MNDWIKVVTHPLGITGYALACVFGLTAKFGPTGQWPWIVPVAVVMGAVSLLGGLALAFLKTQHAKRASSTTTENIDQRTEGDKSPTIAKTVGDVSIRYGSDKKS